MGSLNKLGKALTVTLLCSLAATQLAADDTEIYFAPNDDLDSARPNVLFVFDASSASKGGTIDVDGVKYNRFSATQEAMYRVAEIFQDFKDDNGKPVPANVGLLPFRGSSEGADADVVFALKDLLETARYDDFKAEVADIAQGNNTPTLTAMVEAGRYYLGEGLVQGDAAVMDVEAVDGSNYTPPDSVLNQCSDNHIVLLSFGQFNEASKPVDLTTNVESIPALGSGWCGGVGTEACGLEFVRHLRQDSGLEIKTHVVTPCDAFVDNETTPPDTICTDNSTNQLRTIRTAGEGNMIFWNKPDELVDAIETILAEILVTGVSIVETGVTVNELNRLNHKNDLYFAQFEPALFSGWSGNLKKYELSTSLLTAGQGVEDIEILDQNGKLAVDESTGKFVEELDEATGLPTAASAQSFWTDAGVYDGNQAGIGGASSRLVDHLSSGTFTRKVFSNLGGGTTLKNIDESTASDFEMLSAVEMGLSALTPTGDAAARLKYWVQGLNLSDSEAATANGAGIASVALTADHVRGAMGDPLHSTPRILSFDNGSGSKDVAFFGTNAGMLHALNADSGKELWSFVPSLMLPNMKALYRNEMVTNEEGHLYGIDGEATVYVEEAVDLDNGILPNGVIEFAKGDKAYLYIGMRRGERNQRDQLVRGGLFSNYYAFDISNPDSPSLMFVVEGGKGSFSSMGQTWSRPLVGDMKINGANKLVMVVGGGYDDRINDTATNYQVNSQGGNIFIIDALDGSLLWDAKSNFSDASIKPATAGSLSNMQYSVAADVSAINLSGDGTIEHIYVADVGGQIFRIDINPDNTGTTDLVKAAGRIAHFGTTGLDQSDNRRFFYAPDIAEIPRPDGESFMSIAIGSGYRAHPLNSEVTDHFYVLRDKGVFKGEFDGDFSVSDMLDVTSNLDSSAISAKLEGDSATHHGWYIAFSDGEKVLSQSVTLDGRVLFTTYAPDLTVVNGCAPIAGGSRLYGAKITDGTPVADLNNDGVLEATDRGLDLVTQGIAPPLQVLFTAPGALSLVGTTLGVGQELLPENLGVLKRANWRELEGE